MAKQIVVIDDDPDMQALIRMALAPETDLRLVGEAVTADLGLGLVTDRQPDLVILNHYLERESRGLAIAPEVKRRAPGAKVLLFSAHDLTIEAGHEPAVDVFLHKRRLTALRATVTALLAG